MTALETTVRKIITAITKAGCFSANGKVADAEELHRILDLPFLHVMMMDITSNVFCYANTLLSERAGNDVGWIPPEQVYRMGLLLDPMSFQRVLSELDRFGQGGLPSNVGVITLLSEENQDDVQLFCSDVSALIARSEDGRNTYYAHFFCDMDEMELVNAYAAFDLTSLTARQLETLSYLLKGHSYQAIADLMEITYKTVEKHVRVVYEVTGCQNQAALITACNTL